jgi:aconitase A
MADGVQVLIKEVSLFGGELEEKLEALKSDEVDYYRHGGILHYVLRNLRKAAA